MADAPIDRDDAEFLDDDTTGGPTNFPPEEPMAVGERLTPTEEQAGERFERRVAHREQRDDPPPELDRVRQLVASGGEDVDSVDDEGDEVAWEADESDDDLPAEE